MTPRDRSPIPSEAEDRAEFLATCAATVGFILGIVACLSFLAL